MQDTKPKRGAPWGLLIVGLITMGLAAAYLLKPKPALVVEVVTLGRGQVKELIPAAAAGEIRPVQRVIVRAEMPGTVDLLEKGPGDRVDRGALVLRFASKELRARLTQAEANLWAARIAGKVAKSRSEAAARAADRAKKLRAKEAISKIELERADGEVEAAQHGVDKANATVKQVQAALRLAQVASQRALVHAPFPGIIQDVFVELGVQVAPGAALFDLIDDSALLADVPVDEADIARIFVGQKALLREGRVSLEGQVAFIPPAAGRSGVAKGSALSKRDRAFYVKVALEAQKTPLRVGVSVNAEFLVSAKDQVLYVPTHLVIGSGRRRKVYQLKGQKVEEVVFEPGLTSWERTEVVSGLQEGDVIVSSLNVRGLKPGVRVRVKEAR